MALRPERPNPNPRRMYGAVEATEEGGGFAVTLDGRTARTPAGAGLIVPTRALADVIAAEWGAQTDVVDFATMPQSRLAFTALDRGEVAREAMVRSVARYAEADALCYFSEAPQDLLARQTARWLPLLDWAADALDLHFVRTVGIVHTPQPPQAISGAAALAQALDRFGLTGLAFAAALFDSVILALAVQRGVLSGGAALDLSRLDEAYQEDRWGVDAEAAARTAGLRRDALAVQSWFEALAVRPTPA